MKYLSVKEKKHQPRILHPVTLPFKMEGEIKTFSDKQKQRIQIFIIRNIKTKEAFQAEGKLYKPELRCI